MFFAATCIVIKTFFGDSIEKVYVAFKNCSMLSYDFICGLLLQQNQVKNAQCHYKALYPATIYN